MKGIRGVIFDCDGVLFESRRANLAYYNAIFEHLGEAPVRSADREKAHLCHTAASPQVFETLLGPERRKDALAFAAGLDYRTFIPYMTPEPGMVESLAALSRFLPLAVATNRGTSMPEILAHFDLTRFFRAVVTSRDVARPKPHPDMLHLAARQLGLPESSLLFVGDSELDRDAAGEAGICFAAYQGGVDGDVRIDHHQDLVRMLEG
ncbi:MAG: HAD family hydrolase [Desulfuromonas sp.]|uniref:HAD family hydrolase n=1 Tax=Desulfuromonas sp. TaxID=892 RepID=UPI000CC36822|nr:HAD family hydrolase [Desulfuromonas sp.]PLX85132.1 MAG: HAD family hydrolase [Desulfuromonas sp.]